MRGPRVAAAVVVVVALLLGTQLAFTTVGQELGEDWNGPTEVASVQMSQQVLVSDVAATGGEAGAVAWIERFGSRYEVKVARFRVEDGSVTLGETTTVGTADRELVGVGVARSGEEVAVVWEVAVEDRVRLARTDGGEVRRRTAADDFRLKGPTVAYVGGEPLVAWTGQRDADDRFAVYAARSGGDRVRVGGPTHRQHAPSLTTDGERASVAWYEVENDSAVVTRVRDGGGLSVVGSTVAGDAKVRGGFGGSVREVPFMSAARNRSATRVVWTDVGEVTTATVSADGTASEPRPVAGFGGEVGAGVRGDRWLATWTLPGGPTNEDAFYRNSQGRSGAVARLPGNENEPTPVYAPDAAVAWFTWGDQARVLVAAYQPGGSSGPVYRLTTTPERFTFLSVSALALGVVTLPIMPWSFVGFIFAFVATSGAVGGRALRVGARHTGASGQAEMRKRLEGLPTAVWPVAFAAVEIPFTWWAIFEWSQFTSLGFAHPLPTSLGALAATVVVVTLADLDSGWRATAVYAFLQNAALWSIAGTSFL